MIAQAALPSPGRAASLRFVERLQDADGTLGLVGAQGLALSPDGSQLYVAAFTGDSLALLQRNTGTGTVSAVEAYFDAQDGVEGLKSPASVAVSPDGMDVYVAASFSSTVVAFRRDPIGGALIYTGAIGQDTVPDLAWPRSVAVSPDGANVYAAAWYGYAVVVFSRDPQSGLLQFLESQTEEDIGVGLLSATSVTVSSDGKTVYVTSEGDDAVTVFSRSESTGALSFVETKVNDTDAVTGLIGPVAASVSPDDHFLYVLGTGGLVTFERDPGSGRLEFSALQTEGVVAEDHDTAPTSIVVTTGGDRVYVTRTNDDALSVFSRDRADGTLRFLEEVRDGVDGVDGIGGAFGVVSSRDARFVYVSGQFDDAVAVFRAVPACAGDCNGDGIVTVDEIVVGVNIALGTQPAGTCVAADIDGDGSVAVNELVRAVNAALIGCASAF